MKLGKMYLIFATIATMLLCSCNLESATTGSDKSIFAINLKPGYKLPFVGTDTKTIYCKTGDYLDEIYDYYVSENEDYLYYLGDGVQCYDENLDSCVKLQEVRYFSNYYIINTVGVAGLCENNWYYLGTLADYKEKNYNLGVYNNEN